MLTIRHIHLGGEEDIFAVASFRYAPGTEKVGQQGQSATPQTIWVRDVAPGDERPLTGGTVFVMNENGKTVARYDLGASPVPLTIRESVAKSAGF